jgi:hypothetical protein
MQGRTRNAHRREHAARTDTAREGKVGLDETQNAPVQHAPYGTRAYGAWVR